MNDPTERHVEGYDLDRARAQYEGESLTSRWTIARSITPQHSPAECQAAREELQVLIEETADQSGSARIHRIARKHIASLALHHPTQGATA